MAELEISGGHPQKSPPSARGVSLTHPERAFLDYLFDPFAEPPEKEGVLDPELSRLGRAAGLRDEDIRFISEWVLYQGVHWLSCDGAGIDPLVGARVFRNPIVRNVINAAAERGLCVGTSALKEELEDFFTQRMRNPFLPEAVQDNAADKLAKLKGFYPDSKGGPQTNVQINFVNPYAKPEADIEGS